MSMENDLAFVIDFHMNLYEHQSTYNPNMPLRNLFYVAGEYKRLYGNKSIYSSRRVKIHTPHFVVFYNGTKELPEVEEQKLSESFMNMESDPKLELKVTVYNINSGKNKEILENCRTLRDYMVFVNRVRFIKNTLKLDLNTAVNMAVDQCIKEGILADFLLQNRAEVFDMCIYEWNEEEKEKLRKEEYQYGYEDGIEEGREEGIKEGIRAGIENGQATLVNTIIRLKSGESAESIRISGIDERTLNLALSCV